MANRDPNCLTCAGMRPGMICGNCAGKITGESKKTVNPARDRVKKVSRKAFRGGAAKREKTMWLGCENDHRWSTKPVKDSDWGVEQPQCPTCGKYSTGEHTVIGEFHEDVPCTASCREAEGDDCDCSCAGENHGTEKKVDAA